MQQEANKIICFLMGGLIFLMYLSDSQRKLSDFQNGNTE